MKNKLLVLNLLLTVFAVGCSESAFTPNAGTPAYNTGPTLPNNMGANFFPNYNNQNIPFSNQQGMMQMNPMYLPYQQQNMLSWSMRMNTPGFYYNNYQYRSCIPRKPYVANYTQQEVRRPCPYTINTNTASTDDTTTTTSTASTDTTPAAPSSVNDTTTTKVYPISWKEEDAKALYERLAREEEKLENGKLFKASVKARTGDHLKCIVDGSERRAKNYVCDIEIRAKDGMLLQQMPAGKTDQPEITESSAYKGDLLQIGVPGQAPEVGYLTIAGGVAVELFKNLPLESVQGKVEEAGIMEAKIKTLGQVKCYQSLNTTNTVTECLLKIDSANGKALLF